MKRLIGPAAVFALIVGAALAQDDIRRGTVKKIDPDRKTVTLTSGGKDEEFLLTDETKFAGAAGKTLAERLKGLKEGSAVMFKAGTRDGKAVLVGLKLAAPGGQQKAAPPIPRVDVAGLRPLPGSARTEQPRAAAPPKPRPVISDRTEAATHSRA